MTKSNNNLDYQTIARCLAGLLVVIGGWWCRGVSVEMSELRKDVTEIKVIMQTTTDVVNVEKQRDFIAKKQSI